VWFADLDPTRGHEQAGRRPVLVVSDDILNSGPAGLVVVVPITSTLRPIPSHVRLDAPEGGLSRDSAALCEAVRSVSKSRFARRCGVVKPASMRAVEDALRILLRL
jgi:mRNA interferase MazF